MGDKFAHSLTYFLFLSVKMGNFSEDLFKFVMHQVYNQGSKYSIEVESVVILLFSMAKIEGMIQGSAKLYEGNQKMFMRYLYHDLLLLKKMDLQEYILSDSNPSARIVKATMVLRALTFNKHVTEENFDTSIQ